MSRAFAAVLAVVLLTVLHAVAIGTYFPGADGLRLSHDAFGWIGSIAGVAGTLVGVAAFAKGDHLRRVWSLFAAGSAFLLVGTALRSVWTHVAPGADFVASPLLIPRFFAVAAANVCATWALILLATTYRRSGLRPEPSLGAAVLWIAVSVLALLLGARPFALDAGRLSGVAGTFSGLTNMISTVADTVTIILIAPILRTAFLLRGGRLAWAWWAIGLSGAVWLLYDAREPLAALFPDPARALELIRVLRTPGLALVGLAGFLQREALREPELAAAPQAPAAS